MKILITGCNGQLGTELQKQLRQEKSELGPVPERLRNATVIAVDVDQLRRLYQCGRLRNQP